MTERRRFLRNTLLALGGAVIAGCDRISNSDTGARVLGTAEDVTRRMQKLFSPSQALAKEYGEADISAVFRPNGSTMPDTDDYRALLESGFRDYRLQIDGLVAQPMQLSIADLRELGTRTQITRHDCVEGWSAIGKWTGTPLSAVIDRVAPTPAARYVVFHCFDEMEEDTPYYESIDLTEARHPQTLLAYALNGKDLPVANGAPLRLRVERQLGYKQAKYIRRLEFVDSFGGIAGGKGGYWEDNGYEWYAGI
ncbi:DMSO/TMAO reductase YedYZ molybdopterin-dependent catalytic subunit [Luteibacter rhizovicinus]|uniref:DMSO/TMAO reductase YedYZ molybdopterin-dependent catalytic subunit n=1 Tax=Luteibacter rhizovicinus TaxID=242606 RepID=A0A4V2W4F0_9GAMM|nr:molybdopterin-dependent oxidoreductase [Luteibacter rhizovicinus]TCV95659.1 DMSO/TMAO reductase YedYZ molybdopterin-dependent catalytic subunit [Luteibacter rhizovicinus]